MILNNPRNQEYSTSVLLLSLNLSLSLYIAPPLSLSLDYSPHLHTHTPCSHTQSTPLHSHTPENRGVPILLQGTFNCVCICFDFILFSKYDKMNYKEATLLKNTLSDMGER